MKNSSTFTLRNKQRNITKKNKTVMKLSEARQEMRRAINTLSNEGIRLTYNRIVSNLTITNRHKFDEWCSLNGW